MSAARSWGTTDSVLWMHLRDSRAAALGPRTAAAKACRAGFESSDDSARRAAAPNHFAATIWRLPDYDLLELTSTPEGLIWSLRIEALRNGFVACGRRTRPAA